MSVTTTDNATAVQIHRTLNDYQIRLTGDNAGPIAPPNPNNDTENSNPDNWPRNYRNVPPRRPINYNLDLSQRENSSNLVERAFIFIMLHGVWVNAVSTISTVSALWKEPY